MTYPLRSWLLPALATLAVLAASFSALAQPESPVSVSAVVSKSAFRPGDQGAIAVVFEIEEPWHIWPNEPVTVEGLDGFTPFATEVRLPESAAAPAGVRMLLDRTQWPKPSEILTGAVADKPVRIKAYGGRVTAFLPFLVASDASPGPREVQLLASFQSCDDKVCLPLDEATVRVKFDVVAPGAEMPATSDATTATFKAFDASVFALESAARSTQSSSGQAAPAQSARIEAYGRGFTIDTSSFLGIVGVLLAAVFAGAILNLTPCVLPVIPLKITSLSKSAGDRKRTLYLGIVMSLGVIGFWSFIGFAISGLKVIGSANEIFAYPWIVLAIGAFIALMGLGMIGLFAVGLPQWVYTIAPSHDSARGTFVFGIITAVLGMPCFGPFLGGVSAWALTQSAWLVMAVFTAVGVGNALPYLILSANPSLVKKVPKSGPGSELIKQVMGLLMLAAATFFIGAGLQGLAREHPGLGGALHWWFIALFVATAGLWLLVRTAAITTSMPKRGVAGIVGLGLSVAAFAWAWNQTPAAVATGAAGQPEAHDGPWRPFTPEALAQARASGKVVVVDFTAEWCINCKVLESSVLKPEPVGSLLASDHVVALKADLTSRKAPGWEMLQKKLGRQGIPLLAIWGPGTTGSQGDATPWLSEFYTGAQVVEQISKARGS